MCESRFNGMNVSTQICSGPTFASEFPLSTNRMFRKKHVVSNLRRCFCPLIVEYALLLAGYGAEWIITI